MSDTLDGTARRASAAPFEAAKPADVGAAHFEHRRWIHPLFLCAAILLGGHDPALRPLAFALLGLNLLGRLWAGRHLGGAARVHARKAQQRKRLVTTGPFAWVRNPLYLGNSLGLAGACLLFAPAWLAALAAACSLLWYRAIITWEERVNLELYGEPYRAYLARVPRLVPRLPRPMRPPQPDTSSARAAQRHPWPRVLRRERGAVVALAVLIALRLLLDLVGR